MNFIEFESEQKLRGGFYTNPTLADFLSTWVAQISPQKVLEPSCGDGVFLRSISSICKKSLKTLKGIEINTAEAAKARELHSRNLEIINEDFLKWFIYNPDEQGTFDAVVGNPPFIRYQYLPEKQQNLSETIFRTQGLPFTKHTNAWVPFVLASIELLRKGGRLAMVIPSEILHIPHAKSLRTQLAEKCSRVLIIDPQELWFDDALQGVVLILAEKKSEVRDHSYGVGISKIRNRTELNNNPEEQFRNINFLNGESISGKWMKALLSVEERNVLETLEEYSFKKFTDIADVDVGIVTGANKFFLVTNEVVERYGLEKWAHPMFGRSNHAKGLIYAREDHKHNQDNDIPSHFIWFDDLQKSDFPTLTQDYINLGEEQKLHKRYKCSQRTPWYRVPSVYTTQVAMLKRAHHFPRLILNDLPAFTTDTAYRVTVNKGRAASFVYGFANAATAISAELEGRHYGGGVLELVPSEIERLMIPEITVTKAELKRTDRQFRAANDPIEFLMHHTNSVLSKVGMNQEMINAIIQIWQNLRTRRQRIEIEPSI